MLFASLELSTLYQPLCKGRQRHTSCSLDVFIRSNVSEKSKTFTEIYRKSRNREVCKKIIMRYMSSNNFNTPVLKWIVYCTLRTRSSNRQTDKDFNLHSVSLLSQVSLACSPVLYRALVCTYCICISVPIPFAYPFQCTRTYVLPIFL